MYSYHSELKKAKKETYSLNGNNKEENYSMQALTTVALQVRRSVGAGDPVDGLMSIVLGSNITQASKHRDIIRFDNGYTFLGVFGDGSDITPLQVDNTDTSALKTGSPTRAQLNSGNIYFCFEATGEIVSYIEISNITGDSSASDVFAFLASGGKLATLKGTEKNPGLQIEVLPGEELQLTGGPVSQVVSSPFGAGTRQDLGGNVFQSREDNNPTVRSYTNYSIKMNPQMGLYLPVVASATTFTMRLQLTTVDGWLG